VEYTADEDSSVNLPRTKQNSGVKDGIWVKNFLYTKRIHFSCNCMEVISLQGNLEKDGFPPARE